MAGKPGAGRPKGAVNIVNRDIKAMIAEFCNNNMPRVQELFNQVAAENPEKAVRLIFESLEFVMPKLARTEHKIEVEQLPEKEARLINEMSFEQLQEMKKLMRSVTIDNV
jgi:ribosome-binding ATPase YchF (GTP1/OBG family)